MKTDNYSKELLYVLFSQKALITTITLFLLGVSILIFLFWPREYQASGSLFLQKKTAQTAIQKTPEEQYLQSEIAFLHSQDFATQIVKKYYSADYTLENSALQRYVRTALAQMNTKVLPKSNTIQLTLSGHDDKQNVKLLDNVMKEFIHYRFPRYQMAQSQTMPDNQQVGHNKPTDTSAGLSDYSNPLQELNTNLIQKRSLEETRSKLKLNLIELRSFLNQLRIHAQKNKSQDILIPDNPELNRLFDHTKTVKVEQFTKYIKKLQREERDIAKQIGTIDDRLQKIADRDVQLRRQQVLANRIYLKSSITHKPYIVFFKGSKKDNANSTQSNVHLSVLEKPYLSAKPRFPFSLIIPLGLISGLFLGTVLGFTRESLDHTIKRTVDVEKTSTMPVIFDLPEIENIADMISIPDSPKTKPTHHIPVSAKKVTTFGLLPFLQRIIDIGLSLLLLLITLPLFVFFTFVVLISDGGDVFQKELRLGRNKQSFLMLKFRSLISTGDTKPGLKHTMSMFFQNTLINELPQLLNILLGDMTFVGPRPICPEVYKQHSHDINNMDLRFLVKPGLIGPAQIYVPHQIPYRVRAFLDNRCATQQSSTFSNLAFIAFVFLRLGKNLLLYFGNESMRIIFSLFTSNPVIERRRLPRRDQRNTYCRIMPREINMEEMFNMIGFHQQFKVVNMNSESILVKTAEPFSGNEVTLRLKKQTARDGKPAKRRVVYLHGNMQSIPKYRGDKMSFYYLVVYRPVSPLNDYKVHQHFLKESFIY